MIEMIFDWMCFLVVVFFLVPGLVCFGAAMRRSVQKDQEGSGAVNRQAGSATERDSGRQGAVNRSKVAPAPLSTDKQLPCENRAPEAPGSIPGDYVNFAVRSNLYEVLEFEEQLEIYSSWRGNSSRVL